MNSHFHRREHKIVTLTMLVTHTRLDTFNFIAPFFLMLSASKIVMLCRLENTRSDSLLNIKKEETTMIGCY